MSREKRTARRLAPVLAAMATVLAGCGLPSDGYHGGGGNHYGSSGHYHPPLRRHREYQKPRTEGWSQGRLRQHWLNPAQRPR